MKVKSESEILQSCPTLRDPMDCNLPGFSVHVISQATVLEWGATAFSKYQLLSVINKIDQFLARLTKNKKENTNYQY